MKTNKERMEAERLLQERWEKRERERGNGRKRWRGMEMWKEGEIVTSRRRVQRQGNERLPALHHAQGLPQSAGGRAEMPHVSGLLALPLVCMHLGLHASGCVSTRRRLVVCVRAREK